MRAFARIVLALTALLAAAAEAQVNPREADPAQWLRQVYALYQRAQTDHKLDSEASTALVERRASRALAALIKRDEECSRKNDEVCALDWDFVIDGQDWEISQVQVGATEVVGDRATVTVSFVNMKTPCVNVYYFVREDGAWKVDDIETRPQGEKPTRIARLLRDYKGD
jgi:hypothetical protein